MHFYLKGELSSSPNNIISSSEIKDLKSVLRNIFLKYEKKNEYKQPPYMIMNVVT